ncbi:ATP-binding cassette sub-family A member 6 [Erinaceus europaeus]|uniref:ATP-binding cassette sub-family A member 6 n=1 Tax=Erinaceus europaeus TaxID=9365 RepID=A0ABM3YC35_ERIEU|nr:ATP-binding cassette sub-family A member 6 [Erinaceus europaeus]XP_060058626.1 ATP-binding cassette sub-family A member 6 [Erinaceus europaeus]
MHMKQKSVYQQTQALLCKNFLKKWRMKKETTMELLFPILLGLYMGLFAHFKENIHFPGMSPHNFGRVDEFNDTIYLIYTPITNITQQIMNHTAFASFWKEGRVIGAPNQKDMDNLLIEHFPFVAGIIFKDPLSYSLKFFQGYNIPFIQEDLFSAHCWSFNNLYVSCLLGKYWNRGFVAVQTAINAAIIQVMTSHSVTEELMSITATTMRTLPFISKDLFQNEMFILVCLLYFSPLIYFVSLNVTKERKRSKALMKMMGLQDSAFWLSWGLLYGGILFIFSIFISVIITATQTIVMTGFMVIFSLFFLYGLSLMALTFLITVLLKKTVLTNLVIFLLNLFWGSIGFTVYYRLLPSALVWVMSIFSPFAFSAGLSQIIHTERNMNGVMFPDPSGDSYIMIATYFLLVFDTFFYSVLTLYFDRILPFGDEHHYSPLFFLNSSLCFQNQRAENKVIKKEMDLEYLSDDSFEPLPPEFQGKEAIRIRNVKKEFKEKSGKVEILKGLFCDIYEGQITAIMGRSGAGKSSLLNILNGSFVPTDGSVTIYNKNISEMQALEEIREITGFCPQFNVHFDMLTVKENLRLFAKIRGIKRQEVEQEVQKVLLELDMQNIQDSLASYLSEGQKRKLTFGIAILGSPQILLLDEPTVGLDPFSRHQVWRFLKEHKANCVILLSTSFMDEADNLADRIAVLSNGKVNCAGSSVFLKKRWGLGYNLSLHRNEICDPEKITYLINHHIPDAKLKAELKEKLVYTLPLERTDTFPDLFSELDRSIDQGVMSYDVSMTTLNEVFFKMEGKSNIEEDFRQGEMTRVIESLQEVESPSSFTETSKIMSHMSLWRLQVCAMAQLRFLKLRRGQKELWTLLLVFGIAIFPLMLEKIFLASIKQKSDWEFKSESYFLSPGQLPQDPCTSLLIINNTGSNIEDFIQSLNHQNILLEVDDFENRNGTEDLSYNGAIIVSGKRKDYRFSVVCNTKRLHCFPILMNIISNGLLQMFNFTQSIRTERGTFPFNFAEIWTGVSASIFFFLVVCSISPYIAMSSVNDYKKRRTPQLWVSGLYPSAYWCGQALVDVNLFTLIILSVYLTLFLSIVTEYPMFEYQLIPSHVIFNLLFATFGFAISMVSMTYVISFIFRKKRKNSVLWSFCFYFILVILQEIITLGVHEPLLITCMVLFPPTTLSVYIVLLSQKIHIYQFQPQEAHFSMPLMDFLLSLIPYFQSLLFIFVLRFMEMKHEKRIMRKDPIFRISPQRNPHQNPEEPIDEDEDVQAERIRTATALTTNLEEKPVILASCLRKEYAGKKKSCLLKRKKTLATRNVSFSVKRGEILGLLGPNGAGKSSSIRMISGVTKPTAGEVKLKGYNTGWDQQEDGRVKFLGYCPQENVLWPHLTVEEHLEVFAAVKGLKKADAVIAISRLVDTFKLYELLNVPVRKLMAGTTRKLCFVLSLLGNSSVLLLDEPSTGLDTVEQQQMWQTVKASIKTTDKGALLITHYLTEAEAICDRIAIMVSGRLRCIGSIQHLQSKFGKYYILELKAKESSQVTLLHSEILKLFPQAVQQERYFSFLIYKLPIADVQPLSQAFHKLETMKHRFNLEEYSLSQSTLEKVFFELSKEQDQEDFDEEVDTTVKWKLLPHSDDP